MHDAPAFLSFGLSGTRLNDPDPGGYSSLFFSDDPDPGSRTMIDACRVVPRVQRPVGRGSWVAGARGEGGGRRRRGKQQATANRERAALTDTDTGA